MTLHYPYMVQIKPQGVEEYRKEEKKREESYSEKTASSATWSKYTEPSERHYITLYLKC